MKLHLAIDDFEFRMDADDERELLGLLVEVALLLQEYGLDRGGSELIACIRRCCPEAIVRPRG